MPRRLNLRQVEAFRAVVEAGTVSGAAALLNVAQPAVSKLISNLEYDTKLSLFERIKGRLVLTPPGKRFYEEVKRIFYGLNQLERALDSVRREEKGQLVVGVLPALAGPFIRRTTVSFLEEYPDVFISLVVRGSRGIGDWLMNREIDLGIINAGIEMPGLDAEPFCSQPLCCIMPAEHPLAALDVVRPADLGVHDLIGFDPIVELRSAVDRVLDAHDVVPRYRLETTTAPTLCELVQAGLGAALVHPLMAGAVRGSVAIRPFEPEIENHFLLCRSVPTRRSDLADAFIRHARRTGQALAEEVAPA